MLNKYLSEIAMGSADMRPLKSAAFGVALALAAAVALVAAASAAPSFPPYNHVFLILDENLSYNQVIGSPDAPEMNALAADYGIATHYSGVGDDTAVPGHGVNDHAGPAAAIHAPAKRR